MLVAKRRAHSGFRSADSGRGASTYPDFVPAARGASTRKILLHEELHVPPGDFAMLVTVTKMGSKPRGVKSGSQYLHHRLLVRPKESDKQGTAPAWRPVREVRQFWPKDTFGTLKSSC
jgi:hypothetical protein